MKKIFKYIFVLSLFTWLTACDDFLEEVPVDNIYSDYIYSSEEGLEVGVNALYNRMRVYNFPAFEGAALQSNVFFYVAHDLGHTRTWHRPYGENHTPGGFTDTKWVVAYNIIDKANALITGARFLEGDQDEIDVQVAQARAIRGELYFDLIRMYGKILLDTIATTPENAFDSVTYVPADEDAVFDLITSDFDFAIDNLSYNEGHGRYGQGAARHLRGKVAMWLGDWAEAAEQFDAIVQDGTHHLVGINSVFGQDLTHAEALYVYTRDELLGSTGGGDALAGGAGTWIGSVFNNRAYEISDEIINDVEYGGQALGWSFPNDYLQSLYDQDNDLRYSTYYYPLTKYVNNPASPNFGEEIAEYPDNFRQHHFSLKKFHDEEKGAFTNDSWKDIMYYRFAETLLLGAEAHWRLNGENPGNPQALEYINMVRRRAFGVDDASFDLTAFNLDTYLEESARELAFEKNRWFLLKRIGLLVERQNMYYTYGSSTTNQTLEPMAPHMVNMPIPQSQINLMGDSFPQNDGYF
ncbi:MAG: RagB/SusD family nutrient uptake outer membrane protein [Marinoscillum sp.]